MQLEVLGECGCVLNRELRAWGVRSGWYCWGRLGGATGKVCVWFDWSSIWKWYKFYRFECCLLDVEMKILSRLKFKYFIYCNLSRGLWATKKVWGKAWGFEFDLRTSSLRLNEGRAQSKQHLWKARRRHPWKISGKLLPNCGLSSPRLECQWSPELSTLWLKLLMLVQMFPSRPSLPSLKNSKKSRPTLYWWHEESKKTTSKYVCWCVCVDSMHTSITFLYNCLENKYSSSAS